MIQTIHVNTIEELSNSIKSTVCVVIYGAGMIGGLIKEWLDITNRSDTIKCFINTRVEKPYTFKGLPVHGINEIQWTKDDVVILCALPDKHNEMISELESVGVSTVIIPKGNIIAELEKSCVDHKRNERNSIITGRYDIIFFSQDNNATSGAFISMVNLCDELSVLTGYRILIVLPLCGDGEVLLEQKGLDYTYYYRESNWIRSIETEEEPSSVINENEITGLCDFIRSTGAKLIHNSGSFVYAGGVAAERLGIPTLWHFREELTSLGLGFRNPREAYEILNSSSGVICVSEYVKNSLPGIQPDKVHIIYNGVDEKMFSKDHTVFAGDICRIVMVGHITPHKGQMTLVEALGILKDKGRDIPTVTFVGNSQYGYLEKMKGYLSDNGLSDQVVFAGATDHVEQYYYDADIAVSATTGGEGFDRVRIEAMMAGCLLLANDAGAAREAVSDGETGYLYKSKDAMSLAESIEKVLDDVERSRRIAANARKMALERYTKRINAKQVADLYKMILG